MNLVKIEPIPTKVHITVSDKSMYLPSSIQESINIYWESAIKSGKTFSRGEVFSIKEMRESEDELQVTLHKTDFAHLLFSRDCEISSEFACHVIVANGVILTRDNYFVLGEMNFHTSTPRRLQFIAGGIEDGDVNENTVDIFSSLIREAKEEIGIDLTDPTMVSKVTPRYIVLWKHVALIYMIELAIDSVEFQKRYEQFENRLKEKGLSPEFSSIVLLSADYKSVCAFLKSDERPKLDFLPTVLQKEVKIK